MKKNSIFKKMFPSLSFPRGGVGGAGRLRSSEMATTTTPDGLPKSKSWHSTTSKAKRQVIPHGCFSVYVGEERQKFVIKIECANHPLFKMLLEDAELEYGFSSEGPILIPCNVDLFYRVLAEMDVGKEINSGCGFSHGSCSPFNPTRRSGRIGNTSNKEYGSYGVLPPSRLLKMDHFHGEVRDWGDSTEA